MTEKIPTQPRPEPELSADDPPQEFDEPDYDEIDREVAGDAQTQ
ncbi:hypothetical protein N5079_29710 [Planotetraspora sp. A-T 1434]|nr:hypothetical protein [Planotetraspora sp. A-T 1434]MCT9934389.1 hypothetical protein [Planotetraspora sp. A-T 1434]